MKQTAVYYLTYYNTLSLMDPLIIERDSLLGMMAVFYVMMILAEKSSLTLLLSTA